MNSQVEDPFKISLHYIVPKHTRTIPQHETFCNQRLKLYDLLKKATYEFAPYQNGYTPEWKQYLLDGLSKLNLDNFLCLLQTNSETTNSVQEYYRDDETGHFLLALVSSKDRKLKKLFLNLEIEWFQLKFEIKISEGNIDDFLIYNNIKFEKATTNEILSFKEIVPFYNLNLENLPTIYKTRFEAAADLVAKREVVLRDGTVYFPNKVKYVSSILRQMLTKEWGQKVDKLSKYWYSSDPDGRMIDLVEMFLPDMKRLSHYAYCVEDGRLTSERIDDHSDHYFPLCISKLHNLFKEKSHLKHYARQQYAVFLKNAGMPYEDAMDFFEEIMTTKLSEEDFSKQRYKYYFSHCFGQEGGRIDFPPQSCEDIIRNTPSNNLEHGCPFAHSDEKKLTTMLKQKGLSDNAVQEIIEKKREKKYQNCCVLYFNTVNKHRYVESIASPNEYYACAVDGVVDIEDIFQD